MIRKKNGFTLVEVVIALTFTVIILSIVGTFFGIGNRMNSNTYIKSKLEDESKDIQNKILSFGMEAKSIEEVSLYDGSGRSINKVTIDDDKKDVIEVSYDELCTQTFSGADHKVPINSITINSLTDNGHAIEEYVSKLEYDSNAKTLKLNDSKLSENVESIEIKPADTKQPFADCSTLNINVILSKRKAEVKTSNIKVESNMVIVFRNKGMEEE